MLKQMSKINPQTKDSRFISYSEEETKLIARRLLESTGGTGESGALVIALYGKLGAGKTRFVQGVAEYLRISRNITSPTFVLMKKYNISSKVFLKQAKTLYHFDCYRINSSKEILDIGWQNIITNPSNIVLAEWAERIEDILPQNAVKVAIKEKSENEREIIIKNLCGSK